MAGDDSTGGANDEVGDSDAPYPGVPLYPLRQEDRPVLEAVTAAIRELLNRPTLQPEQIHGLSLVLYALAWMPQPAPGADVELTLRRDGDGDSLAFVELRLTESVFEMSGGGWFADAEMGGESYNDLLLRAEIGCETCDGSNAIAWKLLSRLQRLVRDDNSEVEVAVYDETGVEWDSEPTDEDWLRLGSEFED